MIRSLSAESQLLLCCARMRMDSVHAQRIEELLARPLDSTKFLAAAESHGLLPLVATHLCGRPDTPSAWIDPLRNGLRDAQVRGLHLTGVLFQVLDRLREGGISALTYKGPALAQALYANVALRPFGDVDVLVPHASVQPATEILCRAGFALPSPHFWRESGVAPGQFLFSSEEGSALVELHTERTLRHFPRPVCADWLFDSPALVEVCGREVATLAPSKLLIALAVHGTKDLWERWKWVADIAEFARVHRGIDWAEMFAEAHRLGCHRMVCVAIALAHQMLDADLPAPAVRAWRNDPAAEALALKLIRRRESGTPFSAPERFFFRVETCDGPAEGLRYALRLALRPAEEDWAAARLPRPLYPLLRPFRLLRKYRVR